MRETTGTREANENRSANIDISQYMVQIDTWTRKQVIVYVCEVEAEKIEVTDAINKTLHNYYSAK